MLESGDRPVEVAAGKRSLRRRPALSDISNTAAATNASTSKPAPKRRVSRSQAESHPSADAEGECKPKKARTAVSAATSVPSTGSSSSSSSAKAVNKAAFQVPSRITLRPDPAGATEVLEELYATYYELEDKYLVKPYLDPSRTEITARMRCILVDWLLEVHYKFKLVPQTLWLCVNILDRYLEKVTVERTRLQLVGVAALLLACKYEESGPPEVKDCIFITDYAYDRAQILNMERSILTVLNYELCVPTGYHFLMKYLQSMGANEKLKCVTLYFAERNLQEYDMLTYKPHVFAAASLYAALNQQRQSNITALFVNNMDDLSGTQAMPSVWSEELVAETHLQEGDLIPIAKSIVAHVSEEPITASKRLLVAARKKYNVEKYFHVSSLLLPTIR